MKFIILITFFALFLVPFPLRAQESGAYISGSYLLNICKREQDGSETALGASTACQAYIAGIIDYHKLLRSLGTAPSLDFCVPNTASLNQLQKLIWKYLEKNAHHDAFNAAPAVVLALFEKYPCPRRRK